MNLEDQPEDTTLYTVVMNHEEQYSIWPAERELPLGWNEQGKRGSKAECLGHIKEVWQDMRPLSLRQKMKEMSEKPPALSPAATVDIKPAESLVTRLSRGEHPVSVNLLPEKTASALRDCLERGYVHVRFENTSGLTSLEIRLDRDACDLSRADFAQQTGKVDLVGSLELDFERVRCVVTVDLFTLQGYGHLEPLL